MLFRSIGGGDHAFVNSVLNTFVSTVPPQLEKLGNAITQGNASVSRSIAHQLKPSVDLLYIQSAQQLIRSIEKESNEGDPDFEKIRQLFVQFEVQISRVLSAINQELNQ